MQALGLTLERNMKIQEDPESSRRDFWRTMKACRRCAWLILLWADSSHAWTENDDGGARQGVEFIGDATKRLGVRLPANSTAKCDERRTRQRGGTAPEASSPWCRIRQRSRQDGRAAKVVTAAATAVGRPGSARPRMRQQEMRSASATASDSNEAWRQESSDRSCRSTARRRELASNVCS